MRVVGRRSTVLRPLPTERWQRHGRSGRLQVPARRALLLARWLRSLSRFQVHRWFGAGVTAHIINVIAPIWLLLASTNVFGADQHRVAARPVGLRSRVAHRAQA